MYILPEVTFGVTPATSPEFIDLRHTGTTLGVSKNSVVSEELHPDRQIRDFRHGLVTVAGDHSFEFSYGSFDLFLAAVLMSDWATDELIAGVDRQSFSILREFTDLLTADKPFQLFGGCEVNTLNLTVPAEGIVTGTFGIMGKSGQVLADLTSLGTPTFTDPTVTQPFDSFTGTIKEGAVTIGIVTEVSLSLTNNLETRPVVGSNTTLEHSTGRCNLTGSVSVYFENSEMLEKFYNETISSLEFSLVDPAGNKYDVLIPKIKYSDGKPDVAGEGAIVVPFPFQAVYDDTTGSNIKITRTAI